MCEKVHVDANRVQLLTSTSTLFFTLKVTDAILLINQYLKTVNDYFFCIT